MSAIQRIIFHVDMDAFFASIEQQRNPKYRGKPVIVGADPKGGKGRGVVSTCSYEARKFGIRSGMPISRAWKLCPQAIYLPVNFKLYEEVSSRIIDILRKYADKLEQVSIDECYLDVSKKVKNFEEAKELALLIKKEIYEKEGLTCSVGIGPNKLVAKIASNFQKPNGLTIVKPEEVKDFLSPLPVDEIPGIGKKTRIALEKIGIKTIGELARADVTLLTENFGKVGIYFHIAANGIDESEVEEEYEVKSIGREHTFEVDTDNIPLIHKTLEKLAKEVYEEAKANNYMFKTVTIKVRYEDFETHTHARTLNFFTDEFEEMVKIGKELLEPFLYSEKRIRLVGIRVSKLIEMKMLRLK